MFNFLENKSLVFQIGILLFIFMTRSLIVAGGSTLWIQFSQFAKTRVVVKSENPRGILYDLLHGLKILVFDAVVVILSFNVGLVKGLGHSTFFQMAATFIFFFVWTEIYFYYSHRLMHKPFLYWIHRHHHHARATNPWTSISFSMAERAVILIGVIVIPGALSQFYPISIDGYFLYFLANYLLNVFGHLNVETVPNRFLETPLGRVFNTTTYHALHHARHRGHYGLFTQVLDRFHHTRFSDYEAVHAEISGERRLPSLNIK